MIPLLERLRKWSNDIPCPEADPGLILGCCKILQKKNEHRNDVIWRKIILITIGVQI